MTIRQEVVSYLLEDSPESRKALRSLVKKDGWADFICEDEKNKLRIENYLDGVMSERVMRVFEKMLQKDQRLRREFEQRKRLNDRIIQLVPWVGTLEKAHEAFEEKYRNREFTLKPVLKAEKRKHVFVRWSVAASIVLLLGLGLLYVIPPKNQPSNDELFAEYYEPLKEKQSKNLLMHSDGLIQVREKYYNKDYHAALLLIENLPDNINIKAEKEFFYGLSLMELDYYEDAIEKFVSLLEQENLRYLPRVYWYLSLCYLKTGEIEKSTELLNYLVETRGYNYHNAEKLLNQLQ